LLLDALRQNCRIGEPLPALRNASVGRDQHQRRQVSDGQACSDAMTAEAQLIRFSFASVRYFRSSQPIKSGGPRRVGRAQSVFGIILIVMHLGVRKNYIRTMFSAGPHRIAQGEES
jgi:hypothetical protein